MNEGLRTSLRIAVLTLTRDRIAYTQHCFARLRELAGCDFDHYVLDQGSTDGTADWLSLEWREGRIYELLRERDNIGICRGLNKLLKRADELKTYDAVVKVDNDCEVVTADTLIACAETAAGYQVLCSPRIDGLRHPPAPQGELWLGTRVLRLTSIIGGIFLAAPGGLFFEEGYRHEESNPIWGGDDANLCNWWRNMGRDLGYLDGFVANHYETTDGQHERFPGYFERRVQEGGPE